ncbi:M20/M25/M40 family metallo-hydrolase [Frigidibacter sp. MR17.24]|uniref:M20/M25/M40 family metallo-hydrolase n=1 Tax=Frigidibacter sp. MR17.24 TaxID=3127345 RepID=UPI003012A9F6
MTQAPAARTALDSVLDRIDQDLPQAVDRLIELLRIPSISTDPAFNADSARAADWLGKDLAAIGFDASVRPTPGQPMVMGRHQGPGRHILFYGHYDVQPVDPLSLWDRDPFDPELQDTPGGKVIRGRGASDDKGQLMTFIEACRAWKAVHGSLPGNLTIFLEGEEESGSPSLVPFMRENADELRSDLALICDTGLFADKPAIVTMLRGITGDEITITAASKDLHSGMYGGLAMNPARVLTKILGAMFDDQGRITIPGFYDDVAELPDAMRAQWQGLGFDHAGFLDEVGLSVPAGEQDRTPLEMLWSRPTAEINGIWGGYQGAGSKTVIPSQAHAKLTFRLVPGMDPDRVQRAFRDWVRAQIPADCEVTFKGKDGAPASEMSIEDPAFEAARLALSEEWGVPAAFVGCGGSIPIAGHFKTVLGTDAMLVGFGRDDDQIHSPNEKYDLKSFHKGIRSWARILDRIAG